MAFSFRFALAAVCALVLTALLTAQSSDATSGVKGWAVSGVDVPVVQIQNDLSWG